MANDVAAPLPQVALLHGSVLTVTLDVAGATITAMNVHGMQLDHSDFLPVAPDPLVVPLTA